MDPQGSSRSNSCPWKAPRITPSAIPKDHSVLLDISAANKALTGHKRRNNSWMLKGLDSCKYSAALFAPLFRNGRRLKTQSIRKICSKSVSLFHSLWQLPNYIKKKNNPEVKQAITGQSPPPPPQCDSTSVTGCMWLQPRTEAEFVPFCCFWRSPFWRPSPSFLHPVLTPLSTRKHSDQVVFSYN